MPVSSLVFMPVSSLVFMQDEHDQPAQLAPGPVAVRIHPVALAGIHTPARQYELSEKLNQMEHDQ